LQPESKQVVAGPKGWNFRSRNAFIALACTGERWQQPLTKYPEPLIDLRLLDDSPAIFPSTGAFPAFELLLETFDCHPGINYEFTNP